MAIQAHVDFSDLNEILAEIDAASSKAIPDHILDEIRDLLALPAEEVFSVEVESGVMRPAPTPRLSALMANIRALA